MSAYVALARYILDGEETSKGLRTATEAEAFLRAHDGDVTVIVRDPLCIERTVGMKRGGKWVLDTDSFHDAGPTCAPVPSPMPAPIAGSYLDHREYPTRPGWYCIVFNVCNYRTGVIEPHFGPILDFDGEGWCEEDGTPIESLYDPELGLQVGLTSASFYVPQS